MTRRRAPFPLAELVAAASLLTRLPVHRLGVAVPPDAHARAVFAYPVIGAAIGAIGGLVAMLCNSVGLSPGIGAVAAIAGMVLLTGALHEDGLADTADGLGGGATRARKLDIMRDSRIGSFGALALILAVAARLAAIADQPHVVARLAAAAALGRAAMLLPMRLPPARDDGMAASVGRVAWRPVAAGLVIAAVMSCALLPLPLAAVAIPVAACGGLGMAWLAHHHLRGVTGDVLGATAVIAECLVLAVSDTRWW